MELAADTHRGTPGQSSSRCQAAALSLGKEALAPLRAVTYQISLLTRVPRWSLGPFLALGGRKMGAEQGVPCLCHSPQAQGRALTGRPAAPMVPTIPL